MLDLDAIEARVEAAGRWLVGVDKGRTLGGRDAYCFV
jgi:hypothetical protein